MVDLTWSGNDAYDAAGRRVASVVRVLDVVPSPAVQGGGHSGPGFIAPRRYWEAFVARGGRFDHVVVGGERGRWTDPDEARAAAEAAHRAVVAEASGRDDQPQVVDDPAAGEGRPRSGLLGHVRSLVGAWRSASPRADGEEPASRRGV